MNKRWTLVLLAVFLVLALTACAGAKATPADSPAGEISQDSPEDTSVGTEVSQDDTGDADAETGSDAGDSGDDAEQTPAIDAAAIFSARCSSCHGAERKGANGPPLLPANLNKGAAAYVNTITNGSGPMPSWGSRLSADEINALVEFILSEPQ